MHLRFTTLIPALLLIAVSLSIVVLACTTTTATPTLSPSPTLVPDTPAPTDTTTPTVAPTDTPTQVPEPTLTPSPTRTLVPTDTPSPIPTSTYTPVPTDTATPVPTDTPIPTPTYTHTPIPPTATYTPSFTPTPTDTPTLTPTPTATPTPTDTPTATSTPTVTPTPVVLYDINWVIGDGVSEEHEGDARLAAGLLHDYAVSMGVPEIDDITVYIYHDFDKLIEVYSDVRGLSESSSREIWDEGAIGGRGGRDSIFINTSPGSSFSPNRMLLLTAHELSHAQSHGLHELRAGYFYDEVPEHGPRWLSEGIAGFHEYQVLSLTGSYTYDFAREFF